RRLNEKLERAGLARIARGPLGFLELTVSEYRSLWTGFRLRDPATVEALNTFIREHRPLPLEALVFSVGPRDAIQFEPSPFVRLIQPTLIAIGWATGLVAVVGLLAVLWCDLPGGVAAASLAALTAHGALLFSALFAAGIGRFMIASWPAVSTALLLS